MKVDQKVNELTEWLNVITVEINVRDERLRAFLQDLLASKRFGLFIELYEWSILNLDESWVPEVWMHQQDQQDDHPAFTPFVDRELVSQEGALNWSLS